MHNTVSLYSVGIYNLMLWSISVFELPVGNDLYISTIDHTVKNGYAAILFEYGQA